MCKKVNLDEAIENSEMIKLGDECPFCKGDNKFINTKDSDIVEHIVNEHKPDFARIIGKIEHE